MKSTLWPTSTSQGKIVEAIKIQGLIGLKFGEHGGLVIGHGETADLLRKLKVANIPFKTSFAREVTSAFGLPFYSSTSV